MLQICTYQAGALTNQHKLLHQQQVRKQGSSRQPLLIRHHQLAVLYPHLPAHTWDPLSLPAPHLRERRLKALKKIALLQTRRIEQ